MNIADDLVRAFNDGYEKGKADAEVKHGKWKTAYLDHEAFGVRPKAHYCSVCHQIVGFRTFYCPNCGAKMEEDK